MNFYRVDHNSFDVRGTPWAVKSLTKLKKTKCPVCDRERSEPTGTIALQLEQNKGNFWPDVLGSGAGYPLFIISSRVVQEWTKLGLADFLITPIEIVPPIPEKLRRQPIQNYYWIDGGKLLGAKMDFEASGFVDVQFCPECGSRTDDISGTFKKQHQQLYPYTFIEGSYSGKDIFTTDLSPTSFFCTNRIVQCATDNGFTNFRFVPVEWGAGYVGKAIQYLPITKRAKKPKPA